MRKYKLKKTKKSSVVATITTIIISIFAFCYIAYSVIEAQNIEENFNRVKTENFKLLSKK